MKNHHHPFVRGRAYPVSDPPAHSNWVLLASVTQRAKINPGAEPFVLARYIKSRWGVGHWEVMHGGHYMGATHWAEVAAFDDLICDFAA